MCEESAMWLSCTTGLGAFAAIIALCFTSAAHAALVDVQSKPFSGNLQVQTVFDTFDDDGYVLDSVGIFITGVMTLNFVGPPLLFPPPPGVAVVSHDFSGAVDSTPNPSFRIPVVQLSGAGFVHPVVVPFEYDFMLTEVSDLNGLVEADPLSTFGTTAGFIRAARSTFVAPPEQRALRILTRLTAISDPQLSLVTAQMSGVLQITYSYSPRASELPTPAPVPLPAALPLSAAALVTLGLLPGRRFRTRCSITSESHVAHRHSEHS
jgi:hypothetical protein